MMIIMMLMLMMMMIVPRSKIILELRHTSNVNTVNDESKITSIILENTLQKLATLVVPSLTIALELDMVISSLPNLTWNHSMQVCNPGTNL